MTHDHSALLAQLDPLKSADAGAVFAELIRAGMQALIEAEATEATFAETSSLAADTTFACVAVSSALPAICWLTEASSSEEEDKVAAFCAVTLSGSTIASRVLLTPWMIVR